MNRTQFAALCCAALSLHMHAEPLTKSGAVIPSVSFSETHTDSVATVRDPFDTTVISYEQRTSRSLTASVVADITGIVLSQVDASTSFTLDLGGFSTSFTLGDIPTWAPGKTSAFYCWNGWNANKAPLGTTGVTLSWTATRLSVTVSARNEDLRPAPVLTDDVIGTPGAVKQELSASISFGPIATVLPRKVFGKGTVSIKHVTVGPADAPNEFDLATASVSGVAEYAAPVISLLTPKQGASVGASTTLTGRATDAYGITLIEWAPSTAGPWNPVDSTTSITAPADGLYGATTLGWSVAITAIPPGTFKYYLRGTDPSGNVSAPFAVTLLNPVPATIIGRWDAVLTQSAATDLRGRLMLTVFSSGSVSGTLTLEGFAYAFTTPLARDGSFQGTIKRTGKADLLVKGTVDSFTPATVDLGRINGTIEESSITLASWSAIRSPFSSANLASADLAGRFHASTSVMTSPIGKGYLVITTARTGAATVSGELADGAVVSWSGMLSATGSLPVFASLYGGKGSLSGTIAINGPAHTAGSSALRWFRPANHTDKQFPSGWNEVITAAGQQYTAPLAGIRIIGLGATLPNAKAVYGGDGVVPDVTQLFNVSTTNAATVTAPNTNGFTAVLPAATGLCSGSFKMLPGTVLASWKGLIVGNQIDGHYIAPAVSPSVQKRYGIITLTPNP